MKFFKKRKENVISLNQDVLLKEMILWSGAAVTLKSKKNNSTCFLASFRNVLTFAYKAFLVKS